ncbi:hypothetical protein QZH46_06930 [Pseudomonas corrugata]
MSGLRLLNSLIFSLCFDAHANESATNTSIEANAKFRADTTLAMEKHYLHSSGACNKRNWIDLTR